MRKILVKSKASLRAAGFSLIELALIMGIGGLLISAAVQQYNQFQKRQVVTSTATAANTIEDKLARFFAANGRYPCPAPRDAAPGTTLYGRESCVGGGGVTATTGKDADGVGGPDPVLVGAVPFQTLDMRLQDSLDGWGRKLEYAVTTRQTVAATFDPDLGAVVLNDAAGAPVVPAPDDGQLVLIVSHGEDGAGAYLPDGGLFAPCAMGNADSENCDNDGTFLSDDRVLAAGATHNDDFVEFQLSSNDLLWSYAPGSTTDGMNLNSGNVGIGTDLPTQRLEVNGNIKTDESHSIQVCNGGGTDCLLPATIGGFGVHCPPNSDGMTGIHNNIADCRDYPAGACTAANPVVEVRMDGTLACSTSSLVAAVPMPGPGAPVTCTAPYVWDGVSCVPPACQANASWNYVTATCECNVPYVLSGAVCVMPVNGACGPANGVAVPVAPAAGLCSAGTATAVAGAGPWTWTCLGGGGGSDAACSAPLGAAAGLYGGRCATVPNGRAGQRRLCVSATTGNLCEYFPGIGNTAIMGMVVGCDFRNNVSCPFGGAMVGPYRTNAFGVGWSLWDPLVPEVGWLDYPGNWLTAVGHLPFPGPECP